MTVQGDLATIDLADLLQNIEAHGRTGALTLTSEDSESRLFFREGRVVLIARPGRMPLADLLVATGHVTQRRLDNARRKRRGAQRGVVDLLTGARVLPVEQVRELAEHRLSEDVANLIAGASGAFRFDEVDTPGAGFDPDEAQLGLSLAVAPLVLEATRRVDDWAEIRKFVPATTMHFRARDGASPPSDVEEQDAAAALLDALDGTRSAEEVVELFSDDRFLAHKLLARFVRDRVARPVDGDELLELAEAMEADHPARARTLVQRALDGEPHHVELLTAEARLAEAVEDVDAAVAAHKLLAHLHTEAGRAEEARDSLAHGLRLAPQDPSLRERSMQLSLAQGRHDDAIADGLDLVDLYRAPGLHPRAHKVLERLIEVAPERADLHVEFARTCVDCGDAEQAVRHLILRAKTFVTAERYDAARRLYEEVLEIDPGHGEAAVSIEMIDTQEFLRRRERRRRWMQRAALAAICGVAGTFVLIEALARIAVVETRALISQERMVEKAQYADVIAIWQRVRREHPLAPTSWFELPREIRELEARKAELESFPSSGR